MTTRPLFAPPLSASKRLSPFLDAIVLMKVGYHVDEDFESILRRKQREEEECGFMFWGYGGNACHPKTQVLPFVAAALSLHLTPTLAMTMTPSKFEGVRQFAREYSTDAIHWQSLPRGIAVKGSKFALVCRNMRRLEVTLDLAEYEVAIGPRSGTPLSSYLRFRVDKACATFSGRTSSKARRPSEVSFAAELVEPYAVFLR